ncbi:MAG: Bax inhibitor-1/YccA family protein [Bacillaceae bacterium]
MNRSNPVLRSFEKVRGHEYSNAMTFGGTMAKTAFLFLFLLGGAGAVWSGVLNINFTMGTVIGFGIVTLILALVVNFAPKTAPVTAPIYAILEGVLLGSLTLVLSNIPALSGLPLQALLATVAVFIAMFVIYRTGLIKVTDRFRSIITTAMISILIVYALTFILGLFGIVVPFIHQGGIIGILFSLFVIGVASLSFLLDFDFVERASNYGSPKYMEWVGAFGIIVTFIWLYIEILNLLRMLQDD